MQRNIKGMVVVITGASAGIGRALAEDLAGRGAKLVLAARRLERLQELNSALAGGHLVVRADVAVPEDCQMLIECAVQQLGRIDTLVCNAGYGLIRRTAEMSNEQMLGIFQTNVLGTTNCIQYAVPHMARQEPRQGWRGQIMIVSSAAARRGLPYFGAYAATKAAQLSLAEALRVELKANRIAVTSVHPIGTATDFFTSAEHNSGLHMPRRMIQIGHPPQRVARDMVRAIQRPRAEVWPSRLTRYLLLVAMLFPTLVDRAMKSYQRELDPANRRGERG